LRFLLIESKNTNKLSRAGLTVNKKRKNDFIMSDCLSMTWIFILTLH